MWMGCDGWSFLQLLLRGKFRIDPTCWHMGPIIGMIALGHSFLSIAQRLLYGERIRQTAIPEDPIFIIGHWRTGTTLLHEMMILDPNHNFPTYLQCFDPHHFLLTDWIMKRWCNFLLSERRPMDRMAVGWDRPQEDEFALCIMGQPSPYMQIAFPNNEDINAAGYDLSNLTVRQKRNWKEAFLTFLRTISFHDSRRLVLKSPPHSFRIPTLLEMFPKARFIHIVRNPYVIFPSTMHLWKSISDKHGFQVPSSENNHLRERVLSTFTQLYRRVEETKGLIPKGQYHEITYENLIARPIEEVRGIYSALGLSGFDNVKSRLDLYLRQNATYEPNKYKLKPEDIHEVGQRWRDVIDRYDYAPPGYSVRHKAG
jgi:hypothetical protein